MRIVPFVIEKFMEETQIVPHQNKSQDQSENYMLVYQGLDPLDFHSRDKMEIEEVKNYIKGTFELLGKCLRTSFQQVRNEIEHIQELGEKLEKGLNGTMNKVEEQEMILDNHETMISNIVMASRIMFDRLLKRAEESENKYIELADQLLNIKKWMQSTEDRLNEFDLLIQPPTSSPSSKLEGLMEDIYEIKRWKTKISPLMESFSMPTFWNNVETEISLLKSNLSAIKFNPNRISKIEKDIHSWESWKCEKDYEIKELQKTSVDIETVENRVNIATGKLNRDLNSKLEEIVGRVESNDKKILDLEKKTDSMKLRCSEKGKLLEKMKIEFENLRKERESWKDNKNEQNILEQANKNVKELIQGCNDRIESIIDEIYNIPIKHPMNSMKDQDKNYEEKMKVLEDKNKQRIDEMNGKINDLIEKIKNLNQSPKTQQASQENDWQVEKKSDGTSNSASYEEISEVNSEGNQIIYVNKKTNRIVDKTKLRRLKNGDYELIDEINEERPRCWYGVNCRNPLCKFKHHEQNDKEISEQNRRTYNQIFRNQGSQEEFRNRYEERTSKHQRNWGYYKKGSRNPRGEKDSKRENEKFKVSLAKSISSIASKLADLAGKF